MVDDDARDVEESNGGVADEFGGLGAFERAAVGEFEYEFSWVLSHGRLLKLMLKQTSRPERKLMLVRDLVNRSSTYTLPSMINWAPFLARANREAKLNT